MAIIIKKSMSLKNFRVSLPLFIKIDDNIITVKNAEIEEASAIP